MRLLRDFIELFFPRVCAVCGTPLVGDEHEICTHCLLDLPEALATSDYTNIVEKRFLGRIPIQHATSLLIFKRENKAQLILHQIKYYGNQELAISMGRQIGLLLEQSGKFDSVDILVPVPLHPRKERKRGYNQSLVLCKGIAQTFPRQISEGNLIRIRHTDSQTHKNRQQRLENMKNVFGVKNPEALKGKHILIIDDVITTGATTEACCTALLNIPDIRISIASLAISGDN